MSLLLSVLHGTWTVVAEAAPWLLVGFLLAGLVKAFLPSRLIAGHLGGDDLRSVLLAALYGTPLPLCSCSVIPTAAALRKAGASKGATASFLISTPETGVDSISVTWALLDPWMTLLRPLAALASAVLTGGTVNLLVRRRLEGAVAAEPEPAADAKACCADDECCEDACEEAPAPGAAVPLPARLASAVRYGFRTLLDDLTPVLVLGFLLSGAIAALLPPEVLTRDLPHGWISMLCMLALGTPLYICATASTPIAAALIAKGLDPGAALVFLLVGPATNLTTLLVVGRLLGRRVVLVYLAGVVGVALALGFATNALYAGLGLDLGTVLAAQLHAGTGMIELAGGVLLLGLLTWSAVRIRLDRQVRRHVIAPVRWARRALASREVRCALLTGALSVALVALGGCRTVEHRSPAGTGNAIVLRAAPTRAWEVRDDGKTAGRVVLFSVPDHPEETRFVVQNPWDQDVGMIDRFGRAFRYRFHGESQWVATGTVAEGAAAVLGIEGAAELAEIELPAQPPADQGTSTPQAADAPRRR